MVFGMVNNIIASVYFNLAVIVVSYIAIMQYMNILGSRSKKRIKRRVKGLNRYSLNASATFQVLKILDNFV